MKQLLLAALSVLGLASVASAVEDTNDNGLSDVWERHFNFGNLFPGTFDPQADSDGDGWSNAQEAAAGTNPFDANPPNGIIRPKIVQVPAVLGASDENGIPVVITPEAVTVTWPTIVGKKYILLFSPDLTEESWIPVGDPFVGSGNIVTYGFEVNGSDKRFWRVAADDTDTDSDGLTDAEEYLLNVDDDHDGVPDEWERRISSILLADYGIIAPTDPAQFDVNADYGGINTSAGLVYQSLAGNFDLATTEIVATPFLEGSIKSIQINKAGFCDFPQLFPPPVWLETGPVVNYYKTLRTDFLWNKKSEAPLTSHAFAWTEEQGHRIKNETYAWDSTLGWVSTSEMIAQNWTADTWQWAADYVEPDDPSQREWYMSFYGHFDAGDFGENVNVSGDDPPALPDNSVVGQWTSTTPTKRIGSGADHSTGTQATMPVPGVGYSPTYKMSETFSITAELSDPYTTGNLIADAQTALGAASPFSQPPVSWRNLVENESKISLMGGQYRLGWTLPSTLPIYPGNTQIKAVFVWQVVTDPEVPPTPSAGSGRMIAWKHERVNATPGTLAQTQWHDLPPPVKDGTSWIRPVSARGSITLPGAILVNNDDDDGNGQADSKQTSHTLGTENDLIALNFEATAPGADEKSMIYRLEATGAGKVRLWEAFPNQQPQLVGLPYKLQTRDYAGGAGPRPTYYIEATNAGSMSLKLHAEVLGQKLALVATAEFQSLDISIGFAANMKGVIGDIVPSYLANSKAVHFVTTKSTTSTDAVVLTASGISPEAITPQGPKQLVEWVGAVPTAGAPYNGSVPRTSTGKYPVAIRLIATGQTTAATNVWVTWADLSPQDSTPLIRTPEDIINPTTGLIIGITFRGKISWRYVCQPDSMFDLNQDVPNFNLAPSVPAPGNHPWTGNALAPGASISYDASRQVRVIYKSNDSNVQQFLHVGTPDIMAYPSDPIEGNDDPDMVGETIPYLPQGTTAIMRDGDQPFVSLDHATGNGNPNATIFGLAQFKQFARIQIGSRWYKCSADELSEVTFKLKRDNGKWIDNGSIFVTGNSQFPPP